MKKSRLVMQHAQKDQLPGALLFLEQHMGQAGVPPKAQMPLLVAVEELFVNIAEYAYAGRQEPGPVELELEISDPPGKAAVRLRDCGLPFDPTAHPAPDTMLPAAQRSIGGLGIHMVKKTMDGFTYKRQGDWNVVTISKQFAP